MSDHRAQAEDLAGPHEHAVTVRACYPSDFCRWRERIQAIESALEQAEAEGRQQTAICAQCHDAVKAQQAGMREGEAEGFAKGREAAAKWHDERAILAGERAAESLAHGWHSSAHWEMQKHTHDTSALAIRALAPSTEGSKS